MPETQEKILTVEEAQEKVRDESVYTADTDKTPAEIEAEEKRLEEEKATLEAKELEEKEAEEKAEREAKEAEDKKAEEEAEAEQNRKDEEERLEKDRLEKEEAESAKFKYETHEEAEKGVKEAERKMHEATVEVKSLKDEIEGLKKETSQAVKKGEIDEEKGDTLKNIFVEMLTSIDDLDPSDDSYREKLANVWAKGFGEGLSLKEIERDAAMKAKKAKEAEHKEVFNQANVLAKKAGLDMDFITDESGKSVSTIDYDLFWSIVTKSEPVGDTVEDRINWVIEEVRQKRTKDKEKIINQEKTLREKSEKAQTKNKVLEKGVTKIPDKKEKDETPLSITEALSRTERRI